MTYREAYEKGKRALAEAGTERTGTEGAGIAEGDLDARLLLEYVCGTTHSDLLAHGDREVTREEQQRYERLIARRSERIPLQQITGRQDFMGLEFAVDEHVLIPRQDTEILVEEVLKNLHDGMRILDMCTGSGCILISLLHYSNDCTGVGADISLKALQVAEKNKTRLLDDWLPGAEEALPSEMETEGKMSKCTFLQSDLFEKVEGCFDIIVSNPPYIPSGVIGTLMPEVRDHEPRQALDGAEDGLFFYRRITAESGKYLPGGGMLFFEIGCDQAEAVSGLMEDAGFLDIRVVRDYAGLDRVVYGTKRFTL